MANQSFSNRRSPGPGHWLMVLVTGMWILAGLCRPAMGDGATHLAPSPVRVAQKNQFGVASSSAPTDAPDDSLSRNLDEARNDAGTGAIPRMWVWAAFLLVLVAGAVIVRMARVLSRNHPISDALVRGNGQFRQIAESIGDVFWVGSPDFGRLDYVSPAYETLWGRSCDSLYEAPLSWTDSLFPHDRQAVMDVITRQQSNAAAGDVFPDFRIVRPDGDIRWIRSRTFPIDPPKEGEPGLIAIFQDITKNKFFEASLRESEEKWRSLMENSPDHIMLMDLDGHILFANRGFMGLQTSELVGKALNQLISARFKAVVEACLQTVVANGRSVTCRVECDRRGKRPLIFELRMGPVTVNDRIVAVAVNSTEITDRVDQERERELLMLQLQQAQKMEAIGTLAGGVAHDFNNILSIILGNVELAVADMPETHPTFNNLREIQLAVTRARDIVKQLLGIGRQSKETRTVMHLVPVVEEAVKFLRATIPANIDIRTTLSVDHDVICADPTQIHQIMINLFTNASHAMEAQGGRLSVQAENVTVETMLPGAVHPIPPGRYVRLTVSDTGMGIADDIKDRIFDPYFTTKETGKGTGMGLCMVQAIMKNSGGGIVLDDTPCEGTCFALYFPVAEASAGTVAGTQTMIPVGSERILFVDDETLIVDLSTKMLQRLGYQVHGTTDAAHALDLFEADPRAFDLVITDMAMPGLTGCQLIERIRSKRPSLPVILCSGHIERVTVEQIDKLEIREVLAKPVSLKGLASAVRRALDDDAKAR